MPDPHRAAAPGVSASRRTTAESRVSAQCSPPPRRRTAATVAPPRRSTTTATRAHQGAFADPVSGETGSLAAADAGEVEDALPDDVVADPAPAAVAAPEGAGDEDETPAPAVAEPVEDAGSSAGGEATSPSGPGASTVKVDRSETGWPSAETTRKVTVYVPPAIDELSGWVTVLPSTVGPPVVADEPSAPTTLTLTNCSLTSSLKARTTSGGAAVSRAPSSGLTDTSCAWANAVRAPATLPVRVSAAQARARARAWSLEARRRRRAGRGRAVVVTPPSSPATAGVLS